MEKLEPKRVDLDFETLHRDGKLLINRLLKEYDYYFLKEKDENAEKAILANPLVAEHIPELFIFIKIYTAEDVKRIHKAFVDDMADKYCIRPSQIGGAFAKQRKQAAAAAEATIADEAETDHNPPPDLTPIEQQRLQLKNVRERLARDHGEFGSLVIDGSIYDTLH
jgi:hypothetical protein